MRVFPHLRLSRPLAVLDTETTGVAVADARVVEFAALKILPEGRPRVFRARFNPGVPIPPAATAVHGIRDADVRAAPPFASIARSLLTFLDGCDLAGFNVASYDLPVLAREPDTVLLILKRDVLAPLAATHSAAGGQRGIAAGRVHSFRHYFASTAANSGVSEQALMTWLGHRDSGMIRHYYHLRQDESRRQMDKIPSLDLERRANGSGGMPGGMIG